MIDAVLLFGLVNIVFEFVLLSMLGPKTRLRVLGSDVAKRTCHVAMLIVNLVVHWGTVTGTMSSILAFCASIVAMNLAAKLYGSISAGRFYTVGIIKYTREELA